LYYDLICFEFSLSWFDINLICYECALILFDFDMI